MRFESRHRQLKSTAISISYNISLLIFFLKQNKLSPSAKLCMLFFGKIKKNWIREKVTSKKKFLDKIEIRNNTYSKRTIVLIDNLEVKQIFGETQEIREENGEVFLQ